jgi:hypothetical protein
MNRGSRTLVAGWIVLAAIAVLAEGAFGPSAAPAPPRVDQIPLPTECLAERNHGACISCCKDKGIDANLCSRFCKNNAPPPEPQPEPQP